MATINFNDTSEYMFRNSSIKKGGLKLTVGNVRTTTDLDIAGSEDITQKQTLLTDQDRAQLREMINTLTVCTTNQLCSDKADLITRADLAWNRALNLYPVYKEALDAELDDLKAETHAYICLWENQWARTAGSSLNCLVQGMKNKAEVELARRMAGMVAESLRRMKEHETEALKAAFEKELTARTEPTKIALTQIGSLFSILRGAVSEDVTDRDYKENRAEKQNVFTAMGDFYREGTAIADNNGTYEADASSNANIVSQLLSTVIP